MGHECFWGGGMWVLPALMPIIIVIVLLIIVYLLVSGQGRFRAPGGPDNGRMESSETAIEMVKKRYAKGDIEKEEFERIKKDILAE